MRDRFVAVLTASIAVLSVEAVIGAIGFVVWGQTRESPEVAYSATGLILLVLLVPVLAALGAVVTVVLTVGAVLPLVAVAAWLGRRCPGREAWWWVLGPAAAATALPALVAAVLMGGGVLAGLGGWLALTAALAVPALVARRLLLPDRPRISGGTMFLRVALFGTLAVVTAATLATLALYAGIGYEPPRLSAQRVAGTWSDGKGGTLVLTADGRATATGVRTFEWGDSSEQVVRECTGTGTWEYDPGDGPWSQEVGVSVDDDACDMDGWQVFGTLEQPKLYVYIGDPDAWDLYVLRRHD